MNSIPIINASCLDTSVLPTPVGPEKRKEPTGFSTRPRPARDNFIEAAKLLIAWS